MPRITERPNKRLVARLAVGHDADPWVSEFVYRLFAETPAAGRGGWARALVNSAGPRNISRLENLSVPTLVIGSAKDRLLPIGAARRIAADAPNLSAFVETARRALRHPGMPGTGECPIAGAGRIRRVAAGSGSSGQPVSRPATSAAARRPDRTAPSRNPVHSSAVSVPAQWMQSTGSRSHRPY